jgi:fibronectin type III domain protein
VEVAKARFRGLSKIVDASARTSFLSVFLRGCGLIALLITLNVCGAAVVRADTVTNAAGDIEAQLCPLLDSLTEAAVSVTQSSRATGSTQLGTIISQAETLMETVQSADMTVALGKKSKTVQKSLSRFESQLQKAESAVGNSSVTDAAAWKLIVKAITLGQQLKALVPTLPSSGVVVMVSEDKSKTMVLHQAGDTVCFHVNILNTDGDPSCGPVNVSASPVAGMGTLEMTNETDFCLTMGPDAGTVQVTVSTCNQSNSVLLYDYGVPQTAPPELPAPSNLAAMYLTPTSIELTWQYNSTNELGFQIQRSTSSGGPWNVVATVGAGVTSYTDTGLDPVTTYYYEVAAFN